MSYPTVQGNAVEGLLLREAQSCLGPSFAGSTYQFFLSGTTTPANIYQDGALTTPFPITGFVSSDNFGRFPPIYLDSAIIYQVQFFDSTNTLRWTVDPYVAPLSTVGTSGTNAFGVTIATTGEVTIAAPAAGGSTVSLTLNAGSLGSAALMVSAPLPGASAIVVNTSATTGAQTATFTATNKPGTATSTPAGWLPITCDGVQYYAPIWHGNNFTPYVANPTALGEVINAQSVVFGGNGVTTATGGTATPGNWYTPTTTNIGGGYYIKITKTSGLSGVLFSAATGAFTNITNGGLTISTNAAASISGTYQLSTSVTGSPVVASGTITLAGNNGVQQPTYNGATPLVLGSNGTATLNGVSTSNWYSPTTGGVGTGRYIKITQTGGTSGFTFSAATTYTQIAGGLTIGISGPGGSTFNVTGTYIIASDAGGVTQLGTGSITLTGGSNVQSPNWSGTTPLVLAGNGSATLNGSATSGWYVPNASNVGSGYWIKITRTSGTTGVNFSAAQGAWTNITNSGLTINMTGYTGDVGTVTVGGTYQISSSSGGTPVLGSGTVSLSVNAGTVLHVYTTAVTAATETIPTGTTTVAMEIWGSGGGGGGGHGVGSLFSPGFAGGASGFSKSSYAASALGGVGKTLKYTVTNGGVFGAGGTPGTAGTAGTAGTIVAGTVTGFSTMTANGGVGGGNSVGAIGAGGTASGGNLVNTTGAAGGTTGTSGSITGDLSPHGGSGAGGGSGGGTSGKAGAAVFFYT